MFEKLKNRDIHDPEWLKRQEDALRAHIRTPQPSHLLPKLPIIGVVVAIVIVGAVLLFANKKAQAPSPTPTPHPSTSSGPPAPTPTKTNIITLTPTPTPTPTLSPTATPTNIDHTPTPTPTNTRIDTP